MRSSCFSFSFRFSSASQVEHIRRNDQRRPGEYARRLNLLLPLVSDSDLDLLSHPGSIALYCEMSFSIAQCILFVLVS